jgi:hypothetical protein
MAQRYSLDELHEKALRGDVSYDLDRLYRRDSDPNTVERVEQIRKIGFTSAAASWLHATGPEEMEYGSATRKERLERAASYAGRAGVELREIAEEHGLTHLVPESLENDTST